MSDFEHAKNDATERRLDSSECSEDEGYSEDGVGFEDGVGSEDDPDRDLQDGLGGLGLTREQRLQWAAEIQAYLQPVKNEYGVEGEYDGDIFIPQICTSCQHYSGPEYGDYGTQYSWPYCMLGLFFPTRRGTCKRYENAEAARKRWIEEIRAKQVGSSLNRPVTQNAVSERDRE
jgi:hypothetical protein